MPDDAAVRRDRASVLAAVGLVMSAAFIATAIPAIGAMRVNPIAAMREYL